MNKAPTLKYKTHIVAFLDVLGFREMVQEGKTEKIRQYFNIAETVSRRLQEISIKKDIQLINFSDSIVAFLPMNSAFGGQGNLIKTREFLIGLSILQSELALNDIWLRGGVSIGDLYFDDERNSIFGPGLIQAYDLESKFAKFPRIIIDQRLVSFLNFESVQGLIQNMNNCGVGLDSWNHSVLYDWRLGNSEFGSFRKDYPLFIHYLSKYLAFENYELLNTIIHNLSDSSRKHPVAYEKFRWVGDYLALSLDCSRRFGVTIAELESDELTRALARF